MIFYSTTKASAPVTMKKATLEGLAPDGGLYVPSTMPHFSAEEIALLENGSPSPRSSPVTKSRSTASRN